MFGLAFIKQYATYFKWAGIIIAVLGILYSVYDYSKSKQQLAQMQTQNQVLQTRVDSIKKSIDEQTKNLQVLRGKYVKIETTYTQQSEEINKLRSLTDQYIMNNKPQVQKQVNVKFNTIQKQIECASGDNTKC